jgi:ketosteroid isomerase-like protein
MSTALLNANKQLIRNFYAAMNSRDVEATFAFYAPGAQLDVVTKGPFGGKQPATLQALEMFYSAFPKIELRIESMTAEEDRVAVEVSSLGTTASGQAYGNRYHNLFQVADSKIVVFREFPTGVAP